MNALRNNGPGAIFCAEARTYAGVVDLLRRRKAELGLTCEVLDEITGLPSGYTGKVLGPKYVKRLGPLSLGLMMQAMSLKMRIMSDDERVDQEVGQVFVKQFLSERGRRGARIRNAQSPEKRRASARKAARARWRNAKHPVASQSLPTA